MRLPWMRLFKLRPLSLEVGGGSQDEISPCNKICPFMNANFGGFTTRRYHCCILKMSCFPIVVHSLEPILVLFYPVFIKIFSKFGGGFSRFFAEGMEFLKNTPPRPPISFAWSDTLWKAIEVSKIKNYLYASYLDRK